ncbi:MAG: TraB/GumN family protein [Bacteroidales bacterium]|nr:TraB/GumN family protein [Bacteroidales bacterium]
MLQKTFTFLLLLSISLSSCAQTPKQETGLLWKISGNNLEEPSYLFGTHHLVPLSFLDSINGLDEAFNATKQTIGELDMNDVGEMQMQLMVASLMPEGYSYKDLLDDEDRKILDETLKEYVGGGLDQFQQMKPAMLNMLLSVMMYKKFYPTDEENISMDEHFQKEARDRYRQTVGLETVEEQIDVLFGSQPVERQAESLLCSIKNIDFGKKQMDRLMKAYHAQNLTVMAKLYEEEDPNNPCPSTEEEKDKLNKQRNENWMKQLPERISTKPSFIAVGCLHLVGEDGLINLLRKEGYTVEAVK